MKPAISVGRAIFIGSLVVNGPVFALLLGPLLVFSQLKIDRSYNWIGTVVFGVGFVMAWLWWAMSVPRWRIWAYRRVENIPLLKRRAVEVGLTWPDRHFFSKTEIKSQAMHKRERELLQQRFTAGELPTNDLARFTDRVLVASGKAQRYGTQFDWFAGDFKLPEASRLAEIDRERSQLGLMPLADYVCTIRRTREKLK